MNNTNTFANALVRESEKTTTENGMVAYNTTQNACLDLFSVIGALRSRNWNGETNINTLRLMDKFQKAWDENPLIAMKIAFYARDVREGLGERDIPRYIFTWLADCHPTSMLKNLELIPNYGRFDDWYTFVNTPIEKEMFTLMKKQFCHDIFEMHNGRSVSLLAKWIKTPDASSKATRTLGIKTALQMDFNVKSFKKTLKALRKYIDIVETHMSSKDYSSIKYQNVPARAMFVHKDAFIRHDSNHFNEYIASVKKGEQSIHAGTLYPYEIVGQMLYTNGNNDVLEEQWKALPDYVEKGQNVLVMADTSGSMNGRPICSALGLALYFAERNSGPFENVFMTFSANPSIEHIDPNKNLYDKIWSMKNATWFMSTNIVAAFMKILNVAKKANCPANEMPKALIIVSDMEFDQCDNTEWDLFDEVEEAYSKAGYEVPMIVFWNVFSRHDTYHADAERPGTILVSGQSVTTFKNLISSLNETPYEYMMRVLNSERYAPITV